MSEANSSIQEKFESVKVKIEKGDCEKKEFTFYKPFRIGRDQECEVRLNDSIVSRNHLEVYWLKEKWWAADLNSINGSFCNGEKIDRVPIENEVKIELGVNGPVICLCLVICCKYIKYYFEDSKNAGEHTMMIRRAFEAAKKKHTSKYLYAIIFFAAAVIIIGAYAIYQQINTNKQIELAQSIFYDMKSMELEISKLREAVLNSGDKELIENLDRLKDRHSEMENKYDEYVNALGVYDMEEDEKMIFNMARTFGECELNIPDEFISEVRNYILKWQSSDRLKNAIERAEKSGFITTVINRLKAQDLPAQFFYLALQESDFKKDIVGPETRYGIAKGIWQFIPRTALKYGLKIGPLAKSRQYDPGDERFDFEKATVAAARYISDIYNTEAQASGLLVMASYNWGEDKVRDLILKLPGNPKDRNFWKLMELYKTKIPQETYNYVFYIFSAAVICENPRLFGFDFENPLNYSN